MYALASLCVVALFASACARPPTALRGTFPPLTVRDAQGEGSLTGERVRWGGEIVSTEPGRDETCFEVVAKPLDRQARPTDGDDTEGRFIACAPGFYDPAIYAPKREVTVVGTLAEPTTRQVGEYEYRFPRVRAETVYLWPRVEPGAAYPYPYYYDPFWGPGWGPAWGPWWWGSGGFVAVPPPRPRPRPRPPVRPPRRSGPRSRPRAAAPPTDPAPHATAVPRGNC